MAISKKLSLDNGIETKYHIVSLINAEYNKDIDVTVLSFISKEYYQKALEQNTLIAKKNEVDKEMENAFNFGNIEKAMKLQEESDSLFNKIQSSKAFNEYVVSTNVVTIPYQDGITLPFIEQVLVTNGIFINGKIIK